MPIAVVCPSCKAKLKAPEALIGKSVKCPGCATAVLIKAPAQAAAKVAPKKPIVEDVEDDIDDAPPPPKAKAKPKKPVEDDDFGGLDDITDEPPRKSKAKAKPKDEDEDEIEEAAEDEDEDRPKKKGKGKAKALDVPTDETNDEDRKWAMFLYLSSFLVSFWGPVIIWFLKKKESKFVDWHFKAWVNYNITMFLISLLLGVVAGIGGVAMMFAPWWVGLIFIVLAGGTFGILGLCSLIFTLMAALKAKAGVWYQFPMTKRFWK